MTFPKRWLEDDDDATSAVRDVLRAGREMDPPEGAERSVWIALAGQIGAAGAGGGSGGAGAASNGSGATSGGASASSAGLGGSATGAASGGTLKAILVGLFGGVVAVSGYSALESRFVAPPPSEAPPAVTVASSPRDAERSSKNEDGEPAPSVTPPGSPPSPAATASDARDVAPGVSPAPSRAQSPSVDVLQGSADPAPAEVATTDVGASTLVPGSAEERESRLREENALLGQARAALRSGDPARAMTLLEQARQKFPGGVLGQEREALTIEALAKSGARDAASARAAAFIAAHPTSPHSARLQVFVSNKP